MPSETHVTCAFTVTITIDVHVEEYVSGDKSRMLLHTKPLYWEADIDESSCPDIIFFDLAAYHSLPPTQ